MLLAASQRRRLRRDSSAMFGLLLIAVLLLFALLGPWFVGDPNISDFTVGRSPSGGPAGPSWQHPLGTDTLSRDVLARLAHGARLSLAIALAATAIALAVGTAIGVAAGFASGGRWHQLDNALMRVVDVALAFPYLLLITAIGVALDRADATTVTLILGLTSWCGVARIVRAKTLQIKTRDYIAAAAALGASGARILRRHVLPGVWPTLLIIGSHAIAQMVLAEAVLGYLTVGIEPPHPTWGRMLFEAESYLGAAPLLVAAPGIAILVAALGFTRLGDGLRDAIDTRDIGRSRASRARFVVDAAIVASAIVLAGFAGHEKLSAPESSAGSAEGPRRGGVLRLAHTVAVHKLDPAVAYDEASRAINDLIFARLVTWDEQGKITEELAERYQVLDGGKRFVFTLRGNLLFHDGAPLRAADVKRSLERTLHPKTPCPTAHLYRGITGFEAFKAGTADELSGVRTHGELEVSIELDEPNAGFLSLMALAFAAPVCPSSGPAADPKVPTSPCGAGPFVLDRFERGELVSLRRFVDYHLLGRPYLDGVDWQLHVPPRTQRYRFEQGDLDLVSELTGIDSFRYEGDQRWQPYSHWVTKQASNSIFLNTGMKPFDNPHLRRAVAFAVDGSVLHKVRANVGETSRLLPPSISGPPRQQPMRRHDIAAALREMELAGYPYDPATGRGGYPEEIDYLTVPNTFEQAAGEVFQQQLARVGIRIRLKLVSWASWLELISKPNTAPMGWRGWGADYPDPSAFFDPILTTAAIHPSGSQNVSFFSNGELDRLVVQARSEADFDKRMQLYQRAEEIVRDEAPLVPVYVTRNLQLHQPWVRGYRPNPVVSMRVRDVWLEPREGSP